MTHSEEIGVGILKDKITALEESVNAKNLRIEVLEGVLKQHGITSTNSRIGNIVKAVDIETQQINSSTHWKDVLSSCYHQGRDGILHFGKIRHSYIDPLVKEIERYIDEMNWEVTLRQTKSQLEDDNCVLTVSVFSKL